MPLKRCSRDGKNGWKWGDSGKCYIGPQAKNKAIRQGIAIEGPEKFAKKASEADFGEDLDVILELQKVGYAPSFYFGVKVSKQGQNVTKGDDMADAAKQSNQVAISVDVDKKTVDVIVNGKKISDVREIHVSTEAAGFFGVDVIQVEKMGDLRKITRITANSIETREEPEKAVASSSLEEFLSNLIN